jgi:hypothetical protein
MGRTLIPRYLAALELSGLDDTAIHQLAGNVALAAKTSPLVLASPAMQASVAALATKDGNLTTANKTVADDHAKLHVDIAAEAQVRSTVIAELRTYSTLVTNVAASPADVHGAGLPPQGPRASKNTPPTVPGPINNKPPKTGHGKTTVSVYESGPVRYQYVAQESADGITWTQLGQSHGKTRVVTGASGTKVWVRFAMVRGALQSDWNTPVLITIP